MREDLRGRGVSLRRREWMASSRRARPGNWASHRSRRSADDWKSSIRVSQSRGESCLPGLSMEEEQNPRRETQV